MVVSVAVVVVGFSVVVDVVGFVSTVGLSGSNSTSLSALLFVVSDGFSVADFVVELELSVVFSIGRAVVYSLVTYSPFFFVTALPFDCVSISANTP